MKPIVIDDYTERCGKCGELVKYAQGTGTMFCGASESYEEWETKMYKYCPNCGEKVERKRR